jgi:hypothetical protein
MPSPGNLIALTLFLTITIVAGLWLLAVERRALRPALTTAVLAITLGGYAAVWITVIRHA